MSEVTLSLWLPIGRANFYSGTAHGWLEKSIADGMMTCWSNKIIADDYVPLLQASVLRRLLEVLPRSFGYDREGLSKMSQEIDELSRPIDVTMTLTRATGDLAEAGVTKVRLLIDEHGFYTFTATLADSGDRQLAQAALCEHASAVFGGDFSVHRLRERRTRGYSEGAAAVRRYNGLADADHRRSVGPPKGALSFFQLNTLAEGLCNDTLSPSVFFEQYRFMKDWLKGRGGATTLMLTIGDVIKVMSTEVDAATPKGQIVALHHFLAVTARESLQKLSWSVESVRRSLLDEMMGVLHRQSRLIQLDLGASSQERTPELAIGATESQLRGYVMLVSAKLPLVINVHELAHLAVEHIRHAVGTHDVANRHDLRDLDALLNNWKALLAGLRRNVSSLVVAIEQAWMEKLLYEQEQSRSEQEAMAEIERSRRGRPAAGKVAERAYSSLMLIFTILAVVVTVRTADLDPDATWQEQLVSLWPILVIIGGVFLVDTLIGSLRRLFKERLGTSESYSYEFAFRLDERTDPQRVFEYLNGKKRDRIESGMFRRTLLLLPKRKLLITRRGGGRIERISPDTTLVKFHSVVTFRVSGLRYARFEVVSEVLASRVSDQPRYILRQSRVFGDSPTPLKPQQILELVRRILEYVGTPLAADGKLDDHLGLVAPFYSRGELEQARRLYGSDWAADEPGPDDTSPPTSRGGTQEGLVAQRQPTAPASSGT